MSDHADFVLPLSALRRGDVGRVGGKNASLGEMIGSLKETAGANNGHPWKRADLPADTALSDKPERACKGYWSEAFRPPADATRLGRQNGSV